MSRKGVSLVELMVVVVLVGILLTGATYLFITFLSGSLSRESETAVHSDTQASLGSVKWDLLMTGFALPIGNSPLDVSDGTGPNGSDQITLHSGYFGDQQNGGRWSYILAPALGTNTIQVRRWNDTERDIQMNDYIIILTPVKEQIGASILTVTNRESSTGPSGEDAYDLTLSASVSTSMNFVFALPGSTLVSDIVYALSNGKLMRNGTPILSNVEDFQAAYWVDIDQDHREDSGEWFNDLSVLSSHPEYENRIRLVRLNIVSATKGEKAYINPQTSITVENNTRSLSGVERNKRRSLWTSYAEPRNI